MANQEQRIKDLLEKYRTGRCNADELAELQHLLEINVGLKTLLNDMRRQFNESMVADSRKGTESNVSHGLKDRIMGSVRKEKTKSTGVLRPLRNLLWPVAAVLLCFLAYWFFLKQDGPVAEKWVTVSTKPGQQQMLTLPDQTVLYLNGSSSVKYPEVFDSLQRVVKVRGEVFFKIRADREKPFFVICPEFSVRVLGTAFNVDTEIEKAVSVKNGKVQVIHITEPQMAGKGINLPGLWDRWKSEHKELPVLTAEGSAKSELPDWLPLSIPVVLEKDDKLTLLAGKGWKKQIEPSFNNWMEKDLSFYNQPVIQIARQLSRFYGHAINVSPAIDQCEVTITAKNKSMEQVMNTLALISNATLRRQGENWALEGNGCE